MSKPTKKKDHLFIPSDLVQSVLRGKAARACCGVERVFTREDFDDHDYYGTCAPCVTAAAAEQPGDTISTLKKRGWTELLEKAFLDVTAPPTWTYATFTWTSNTPGTSTFPPAA